MAQQDLRVNIKGDASGLTNALGRAEGRMKSFGSKMKSIGGSLQTRLALPLLAVGGAATKMAFDFDKSLTQIKSLVGIAGDEVDAMGRKARQMAIATGKSGAEAADALFFITSAGLRGDEAMQTLNASLKAAAIGLGDTKTIADLATSAMNAYGSDTLSASDATDILVAAVREGKLEASELAGAMGGVIPVASNMGVGFEEIGAAMAAMSRTGTNAANAATQLNAILASIAKPTSQSTEAFAKMGYSVDDLKKMLDKQGLLQTLINLKSGLDETGQTFTDIVPNIRAWKGVLDLTGAGLESNKEIFDALTKSMGATNTAFKETSKSASFKLTKSVNQAKESLASLGQQLLVAVVPIIEKAANFVSNLYREFKSLDETTQNWIIGLSGFAIVLPTIIGLIGTLSSVVGALLSPVGLVIAALAAVAYVIYKNWGDVLPVITNIYNDFVDLYNQSALLRVIIGGIGSAFKQAFKLIRFQIDMAMNSMKTLYFVLEGITKGVDIDIIGMAIRQGFDKAAEITSNFAKDIGDTFSDDLQAALDNQLEYKTSEQIQESLNSVGNNLKDWIKKFGKKLGLDIGTGVAEGVEETNEKVGGELAAIVLNASDATNWDDIKEKLTNWQKWALSNAEAFSERLNGIVQGGIAAMIGGFAEAFGTAIVEGGNLAGALGEILLGTIADILKQLGMAAIQIGLSMIAIKMAFKNPFTAIAAGTALLALGAAMSAAIPTILGQKSTAGQELGGRGTAPTIGGIPAFANGGLVFGPTMGLMGEYPGARSNPEVIAPLSKLQSMIGERTADVNVGGEFVVRGTDLVVVLDRANKSRNRII